MIEQTKNILISLGKPFFQVLIFLTKIFELIFYLLKEKVRSRFFKKKRGRPRKKVNKLNPWLVFSKKKKRGRPKKAKKKVFFLKKGFFPLKRKKRTAFALTLIGTLAMLAGGTINLLKDLPSPDRLIERGPHLTTKIYDRSKVLLYKIYRDQNRSLVPLSKIPDHLIQATLAIEDKNFYNHDGLSWTGILRAFKHNLFQPNEPQIGGSTITQQLVKNTLLTSEKTLRRKIREAILAVTVELKFSKKEILEMYFNEVPYGGTAYGVEEASQKYFGKHVWEINIAEAAFLAGLTKAPTKYSPFSNYPELSKKRQEQVIKEMVDAGYLTQEEAVRAIDWPLVFNQKQNSIKAPHFVFYIKEMLIDAYGIKAVEQGGLEVVTTLDWKIQQVVEKITKEEIDKLKPLKINNGAALVIKPGSGEVLAMVGSKDYFDFENDGNVNVTLRPRQPGSAIKPINYALALEKGYTAATIIPDTPITYQFIGQPPYSPRNYDGRFHGNISVRTALASSFNVPAVKILSSYGVGQMIKLGQIMGITTWSDPSRFGLALTLGGGEVKMIDLAQIYSSLANLGKTVPINPFMEIKDYRNKTVYKNQCIFESICPGEFQAIKPETAFILNDILSDNNARTPAFGPNSLLKIPDHKVAVKTGTSNSLRDNWCIGYTPSILVAAWVGNNDNSPMSHVASGVTGATPIWNQIISKLTEGKPDENWSEPGNLIKTSICQTTGTLPCQGCPEIEQEYFIKGTEPTQACKIQIEDESKKVEAQTTQTSKKPRKKPRRNIREN